MDKFLEFLRKNWAMFFVCIVIVLFAVLGIPLFINWAFGIPAWCNFFAVDWEAKDALSYYGDALGFVGTVIFSGLALWQNHVIKIESDKHTNLLERMENQKNMPILYFGTYCMSGKCGQLSMYIENISDNIATEIRISEIKILNEDGTEFWNNGKEQRIAHLKEKHNLSLKNPDLISKKQIFSFQLSYQDKFGELHQCNVEGRQMGQDISFPRFFIKEIERELDVSLK